MNPIFTLQFNEWTVAEELKEKFKDCSVFIPLSRQEKGIDLLLYSYAEHQNMLTFQVKSSRTYLDKTKEVYYANMFFNRFSVHKNADWYILCGICPLPTDEQLTNFKWKNIMLAFTNNEMQEFLDNIHTKKDITKQDSKFQISFNLNGEFFLTRGCTERKNLNKYLFENRINDILNSLLHKEKIN